MLKKQLSRLKRHGKIRKRIFGTAERPRLSVRRSLKNIYAQVIDDISSVTLASASTMDKTFSSGKAKANGNKAAAEKMGKLLAEKLKTKGIQKIAFDRSGYLYHGRIKALADSLRKEGIQF